MSSYRANNSIAFQPQQQHKHHSPDEEDDALAALLATQASSGRFDARGQQQKSRCEQYKRQILNALLQHQTLLLTSCAGSQANVELPLILSQAMQPQHRSQNRVQHRVLCCVQRRANCEKIAQQCALAQGDTALGGDSVGYALRNEHQMQHETRVVYMQHLELLSSQLRQDPLLLHYSAVVIDSVQVPRSAECTMLLSLVALIARARPQLRIVLLSDAIDSQHSLQRCFEHKSAMHRFSDVTQLNRKVTVLSVAGALSPLTLHYALTPVRSYLDSALATALHLHQSMRTEQGDFLVFVPCRADCDTLCRLVNDETALDASGRAEMRAHAMHKHCTAEQLTKLMQPVDARRDSSSRRIIVATQLAETCAPLPNIAMVIDTGLVERSFKDSNGYERTLRECCSQAEARQRASCAQHTESAGHCYRLFTEAAFHAMPRRPLNEMQRGSDLSLSVLTLLSLGVRNVLRFPSVDPPPVLALASALDHLHVLQCIDAEGRLTPDAHLLQQLPLSLEFNTALLASSRAPHQCSDEMCTILAMMSQSTNLFATGSRQYKQRHQSSKLWLRFAVSQGDALTYLNLFHAFEKPRLSSLSHKEWCDKFGLNLYALQQAQHMRRRLVNACTQFGLPLVSCNDASFASSSSSADASDSIHRSLLAGLYRNVAQIQSDGSYRCILDPNSSTMQISHASALHELPVAPSCIAFASVHDTASARFMQHCFVVRHSFFEQRALALCYKQQSQTVQSGFDRHLKRVERDELIDAAEIEASQQVNAEGLSVKHRKLF